MRPGSKRLGVCLAIGLAVGLAAAACHRFGGKDPTEVGQGPAGPAIAPASFKQPWTDREVLLVGLGDSITAGFGARKGYSYFDRLAANPPGEFADMRGLCLGAVFPKLRTKNLAVSGSTSRQHLEKQFPRLGTNANVLGLVVITTGGNDLIHNYGRTPPQDQAMFGATWEQAQPWIADFAERLELMVRRLNEKFPAGCHIFLADIYDPTDGEGDIENAGLPRWKDGLKILGAYNEALRRCAAENHNVHLVDLHSAFLGHGIHCRQPESKYYNRKDPRYWFYENLEDPNEFGYDVIRRLFLEEIAKIADQMR